MKKYLFLATLALSLGALNTSTAQAQASNIIYACYHKNTGDLRKVSGPGQCKNPEIELSWNIKGPKGDPGDKGAPGDKGEPGPAGPTYMASGVVDTDGTILVSSGHPVTITRTEEGHYKLQVVGLGTGCPLPALTPIYGGSFSVGWGGGDCGNGNLETTVLTSDLKDHPWSYLLVGTP